MRLATAIAGALSGPRTRGYLQILAVVSGARVFGLASQFVVLVVLSRILSKDSFGDMMTAFGFYRLAGIALGVGPSLLLLFHVSRRPHDQEAEVKLHRYAAMLGALVSAIVAVVGVLAAGPIATALDKPGLAAWFVELAPFAVFSTLLVVATGALEGRSRISESIVLGEVVPNAIRIVLLPLVALMSLSDAYVAHVLTLSVLLPWLWTARRLWNRSIKGITPWTPWDYSYSGKFVVATLFAQQLAAVDILVAGVLFSSPAVADYAVASRIAALYSFFQLALLKRFAPRAGHLIGDRRHRRAPPRDGSVPTADDRLRRVHHLRHRAGGAVPAATLRRLQRRGGTADLACDPDLRGLVLRHRGSPPDRGRAGQCRAGADGILVPGAGDDAVRDKRMARHAGNPGCDDFLCFGV